MNDYKYLLNASFMTLLHSGYSASRRERRVSLLCTSDVSAAKILNLFNPLLSIYIKISGWNQYLSPNTLEASS